MRLIIAVLGGQARTVPVSPSSRGVRHAVAGPRARWRRRHRA